MSVDGYMKLKGDLDKATAERAQVLARAHEIVKEILKNPERFYFSDCDAGIGFPPELIQDRGASSAKGSDWPDAKKIQHALANWHLCRRKAKEAYNRLTPQEQSNVSAPL